MDLAISVLGLVLVVTGFVVYVRGVVLAVRSRAAGSAVQRKVFLMKREGVAVGFELVGVVLVIAGGTFVS